MFKSDKVGEDSRNFPVENVSWDDVLDFISRLNAMESKRYRLPTEAEWEYACRSGGEEQEYCGGNTVDAVAWYRGNLRSRRTFLSGTKDPNGLGIYDMSGNVFEWCMDRYFDDFYSWSPEVTPLAPDHSKELDNIGKETKFQRKERLSRGYRVLRGGSFADGAEVGWYQVENRTALRSRNLKPRLTTVRAAARFAAAPDRKQSNVGFRLVVANP
jgi:formylglycine-generating enzyme required for sulfatase activity